VSDDSSDALGIGIALGVAAALALVAVGRRLRGTDEDPAAAPADLDDEMLLLTIQTRFSELEEHMTELYDRVGLETDTESTLDFELGGPSEAELIDELAETDFTSEEVTVDDDIDLDGEELGL
jgi:hypothetical protein